MTDKIFSLLRHWEEPSLWECLRTWDRQLRAQLEYAHIPSLHAIERTEALGIADKYTELINTRFSELFTIRDAIERIAPDLVAPLDIRGPAEIVSPIDHAHAVRDLARRLKTRQLTNTVPSTPAGGQQTEGAKPKPDGCRKRGRGKNIDAQMLKTLADNREAIGWSVRKWAEYLECHFSTVAETRTWKEHLAKYRDAQRIARAERSLRRRT
jgi:hypothetical protein